MANGGKRPGAGRPKGSKAAHTIQAEAFRAYLIEEVLKEKEPLVKALIREAKLGNVPALKEVNERVLGKATDKVELTGEAGLPFSIVIRQKE